MKHLLFLLSLTISLIASGQTPYIKWQRGLGGSGVDFGESVCISPYGGYLVAGYTYSKDGMVKGNHGDADVWVINTNSSGNLLWAKCFGGSYSDFGHAIQPALDGGYIVAGSSLSYDGQVTGHHGGNDLKQDYWVVKIDMNGNLQWQKSLGGTGIDFGYDIKPTADGGYIVFGDTNSTDGDVEGNHGGYDCWAVKLDSVGNIAWKKCYGGTKDEHGFNIQITPDGGYIFAGSSQSNDGDVSGNHGGADVWIVKLDSIGTMQWQKCLGGSKDETGFAVEPTKDSGYVVAGRAASADGDLQSNQGNEDYWIVKLNSARNIQWQKVYGGGANDDAYDVKLTSDGGYIAAGFTESGNVPGDHDNSPDAWVFKFNSTGDLDWQKVIGGPGAEYVYSILEAPGGGFVFAGASSAAGGDVTENHGDYDLWMGKLNIHALPVQLINFTVQKQHSDAFLHWQTAGELNSKSFNIQRSADGVHFATIGSTPAAGESNNLLNYSYTDVNVAALHNNTLYYRLRETDVDGDASFSQVEAIKFGDDESALFAVVPNPVRSVIKIRSGVNASAALIQITDVNGKIVYSSTKALYNEAYTEINASNLTAGTYIITINVNGVAGRLKVIKQ